MRFAQIRSNDSEQLFVSNWGKPENWFSNSAFSVIYVEDLSSATYGGNNVIAFGVVMRENFS